MNTHEKRLSDAGEMPRRVSDIDDPSQPVLTVRRAVPIDWLDYNGHMTESRYLNAFADASDRLMEIVGCDQAYIASGGSFFTAETHIRHLGEAHLGDRIEVCTRVLMAEGKKMHLWHEMSKDGEVIATGEHILIHVSLETRRPAPFSPEIDANLRLLADAHKALDAPDGVGRFVGARR